MGKLSEEECAAIPYSFFVDRCRRVIKPPEKIIRDVESLLELYQATEYLIPGDPEKEIPDREQVLVSERTWRVWEREKPHVGRCLKDPSGVNLYIEKTRKEGDTGGYSPDRMPRFIWCHALTSSDAFAWDAWQGEEAGRTTCAAGAPIRMRIAI